MKISALRNNQNDRICVCRARKLEYLKRRNFDKNKSKMISYKFESSSTLLFILGMALCAPSEFFRQKISILFMD
jgi:hypothetical protein